jgi:hypothetical protein
MDRLSIRILALQLLAWPFAAFAQAPLSAGPAVAPAPALLPQGPAPASETAQPQAAAATLLPEPAPAMLVPVSTPPAAAPAAALPPSPPASPYSLPWAMRPIIPVTALRLDTAIAFYDYASRPGFTNPMGLGSSGQTAAIMPTALYKFTPNLAGLLRWGIIANSPPEVSGLSNAVSVTNILAGALYGIKLPAGLRLGLFFGMTLPIGTGGFGNVKAGTGDPNSTEATNAGVYARSGMDNVLFAVNDFSLVGGLGFAYVGHRLTAQLDLTILQLMRVKNEGTQADKFRTNSTWALHVGYFFTGWLSAAVELRYQRFLSDPAAVVADEASAAPLGRRDTLSLALGPRFHVKASRGWFRPSIAYAPGLSGFMATSSYHVLIVDLPYIF